MSGNNNENDAKRKIVEGLKDIFVSEYNNKRAIIDNIGTEPLVLNENVPIDKDINKNLILGENILAMFYNSFKMALTELIKDEEISKIFSTILKRACKIQRFNGAFLSLWNSGIGFYNTIIGLSKEEEEDLKSEIIFPDSCLAGKIYTIKEVFWVKNYSKSVYANKMLRDSNISFAIGAPIFLKNICIGVVILFLKSDNCDQTPVEAYNNFISSHSEGSYETLEEYFIKNIETLKKFIQELSYQLSLIMLYSNIFRNLKEENVKLKNTELFLNELLNNSPNLIFVLNIHGNVVIWNNLAYLLTGFKPSEIISKRIPFMDDKDLAEFNHVLDDVKKGVKVKNKIIKIYSKQNKVLHILCDFVPLTTNENEIEYILVFGENIENIINYKKKLEYYKSQLDMSKKTIEVLKQRLYIKEMDLNAHKINAFMGRVLKYYIHKLSESIMYIENSLMVLVETLKKKQLPRSGEESLEKSSDLGLEFGNIIYQPIEFEKIKLFISKIIYYRDLISLKTKRTINLANVIEQSIKNIKKRYDLYNLKIEFLFGKRVYSKEEIQDNLNLRSNSDNAHDLDYSKIIDNSIVIDLQHLSFKDFYNIYANYPQLLFVFENIIENAVLASKYKQLFTLFQNIENLLGSRDIQKETEKKKVIKDVSNNDLNMKINNLLSTLKQFNKNILKLKIKVTLFKISDDKKESFIILITDNGIGVRNLDSKDPLNNMYSDWPECEEYIDKLEEYTSISKRFFMANILKRNKPNLYYRPSLNNNSEGLTPSQPLNKNTRSKIKNFIDENELIKFLSQSLKIENLKTKITSNDLIKIKEILENIIRIFPSYINIGLGLSVSNFLINNYSGIISIKSEDKKNTIVRVTLPNLKTSE
ncbi:MAG: PAS domain-containing protein [Promethearchaeota archaeon]